MQNLLSVTLSEIARCTGSEELKEKMMRARDEAVGLETALGIKRPLQMTKSMEIVHTHLGTVRQLLLEGRDREALLLLRGAVHAVENEVAERTHKDLNRMDYDGGQVIEP